MTTPPDVKTLFGKALELTTPADRAAFLDEACAGNLALRREVEALLHALDRAGDFMNQPGPARTVALAPPAEGPGTVIGPYKLLEQIGEGGMGTVFMAEQTEPVRRMVALKIIKPGMDSAQVITRFEAERQALALMDHPNIARVLDAGATESGRPYFVMELVKGVPITKFCDENRLTPRQRLELFVPVCQAVQHAHTKGVIHRDLKPSNVLVALYDDKPVPKVIDFGVAKATSQRLTARTLFTGFGAVIGTLEYMSPEQAKLNALDIDTRSDVYALGVLLYELLTGSTPLEQGRLKQAALDEVLRLIREEEPQPPSTRLSASGEALAAISSQRGTEPAKLGKVVRGELDWIVMKALEKDRTRRYETANGLARDVERYLKDEPIDACPPSAGYRLRKFARKHRKLLGTAAVFAALLFLGATVSTWQAMRATQAEAVALANERAAKANAMQAEQKQHEANQQRKEAEAAQAQLRRTLYAVQINLAQQAWDKGGVDRTRELLEQHRPKREESDLRGFEWHYLYRLSHADLVTVIKGHADKVLAVAYSPDGKHLASASTDKTVKVWDAQTGQELFSLPAYGSAVAFSPDGERLAGAVGAFFSGGAGGKFEVKIWNARTGQELMTLKEHKHRIKALAFSPDGKRVATTGGPEGEANMIRVWDAQTGQELLSLTGRGMIADVAFSPDGKRLAAAGGGAGGRSFDALTVWDAQSGKELFDLKGHEGSVHRVAFSPDGQRLASTSIDKTVKVWDVQTGKELLTLKGHTDAVHGVAFSPDGKYLASASADKTIKVWDAKTGDELRTLKGHTDVVHDVAFSPKGECLASASDDRTVMVWEAKPVQKSLTLKLGTTPRPKIGPSPVSSVAFSLDGKRLTSKGSGRRAGGVTVWDAQTGKELFTPNKGGLISPDCKLMANSFSGFLSEPERLGEVEMWDVEIGQKLSTIKGHGLGNAYTDDIAFSADGARLVRGTAGIFGGTSNGLKVWDAKTGQELLSIKGGGRSPVFSPDGKRLASGDPSDRTVKVWDAQTGQELLTLAGHVSEYPRLAFSPDGNRLVSVDYEEAAVKVWDAQTGQEVLIIKGPVIRGIKAAFSPDGKRLAIHGKVWDAEAGQELLTLKGHTGVINTMVFSPDGKRLASAGTDATVKVWDAQTGQELLTVEGHNGQVNGVAFSPDGHRLAAGGPDGTVKIWDATPLPEN